MEKIAFFIKDMGLDAEAQKIIIGMLRSKGLSEGRNLFVIRSGWDYLHETREYKDFIQRASKDVKICCIGGTGDEPFANDPSLVHVKRIEYDTPDKITFATRNSLVEEVAKMLNVRLSYEARLVTAYEKGRVPAMQAFVKTCPDKPSCSDPSYDIKHTLDRIYSSAGLDHDFLRDAMFAVEHPTKYPSGLTSISIKWILKEKEYFGDDDPGDYSRYNIDQPVIDFAVLKYGKLDNFLFSGIFVDRDYMSTTESFYTTYYGDKATIEYLKSKHPDASVVSKTASDGEWIQIDDEFCNADDNIREISEFQTGHLCLPFFNIYNAMTLVEIPATDLSKIDHIDVTLIAGTESGSIYLKNGECVSFQAEESRELKNAPTVHYRIHEDYLESFFSTVSPTSWEDSVGRLRAKKTEDWTEQHFGKSSRKENKPNIFDEAEERYYDELVSCARKMSSKNRDALLQTAKRLASEHKRSHANDFSSRTRSAD